jgi:cellulose synthase/poly-beta-1,6-N-acetylglucosamine synthase-like glycosyltransferase
MMTQLKSEKRDKREFAVRDPQAPRRLTLAELPPPPRGKTGWPWTRSSTPVGETRRKGGAWPRISIVTPSYNQGQFIEETIRSVLLQGYPNLEYIVMDGGSKDNTLNILRKYEHAIDFWVSAPDKGQAEAINKGFARANGDILAWLNSDDVYEMDVFARVAEFLQERPDVDVVSGRCRFWCRDGSDFLLDPSPLRTLEDFLKIKTNWVSGHLIVQPEAFFRRRALEMANGIREELTFSLDACLWIDMAKKGCVFHSVDQHWANFRLHDSQKTWNATASRQELARMTWDQVRGNFDKLEDPLAITDEIVQLLEECLTDERRLSSALRQSTSYRVGRILTKMKIW